MKFDLAPVKYSRMDRIRRVKIPNAPSVELAEEIAIHLGDGYLSYDEKDKSYRYGVGFDKYRERIYANHIAALLYKLYHIKPPIYADRIELMSLAIGSFKHKVLKFPIGRRKGNEPLLLIEWLFEDELYIKAFIRGLIDTEGSVKRLSRTIGLVVKMRSSKVIKLLAKCISSIGFKPKIYSWIEKGKPIYAVYIIGTSKVEEFLSTIKPANKCKLIDKFQFLKQHRLPPAECGQP